MKAHKLTKPQITAIEKMGDMGSVDGRGVWMALPPINGRTLEVLEREGYVIRRESDGMWRLTDQGITAYRASKTAPISNIPAHAVTAEAHTMTNGDIAYTAVCEHGWTTGFHTTAVDAEDVAMGHGDVSRPLYIATEGGTAGIDPMIDTRVWWAGATYVVRDWDAGQRRNLIECVDVDDPRQVAFFLGNTSWTARPMAQYVEWDEARIVAPVIAEAPAEPFRAAKGKSKVARRSRNRW